MGASSQEHIVLGGKGMAVESQFEELSGKRLIREAYLALLVLNARSWEVGTPVPWKDWWEGLPEARARYGA